MTGEWKSRIFAEKSLWEVYRISFLVLPKPKINGVIFWISAAMLIVFLGWVIYDGGQTFTDHDALVFLRYVAAQGMSLSIGILGFLIAGFAVFASITRAEIFITLAKIAYKNGQKETGIYRLQFVFFNFINVFTVYIGLLTFSMMAAISFSESSPVVRVAAVTTAPFPLLPLLAITMLTGGIVLWLVAALLKLKAFVWNLYQTVLVAIATESEFIERERERERE